jgi:small subunit ribosomal protein S6
LAVNVYEGLFIFDSSKYSSDPTGVSGQIGALVTKHGGEMLASRLWEDRRLAYPINGKKTGTYWLTYFKIDSRKLNDVKQESQLSETILRSMVIKIDARIAEAVVSHALTSTPSKPPAPKPAAKREEAIMGPEESIN